MTSLSQKQGVPLKTETLVLTNVIAPGISTITGGVNNLSDSADTYSLAVNAGEPLALSLFASRLNQATDEGGAKLGLLISDITGETIYDQSFRHFVYEDNEADVGPYISHVFGETDTVRIEVYVSNADVNIEEELTQPYRLEGILAPF